MCLYVVIICLFLASDCVSTRVPFSSLYAAEGSLFGSTGQEIQVDCADGYQGGGVATCLADGVFDTSDVSCDPLPCASISVPHSDYATGGVSGSTGDVVKVTCDSGFVADFYSGGEIKCQSDGSWTPLTCYHSASTVKVLLFADIILDSDSAYFSTPATGELNLREFLSSLDGFQVVTVGKTFVGSGEQSEFWSSELFIEEQLGWKVQDIAAWADVTVWDGTLPEGKASGVIDLYPTFFEEFLVNYGVANVGITQLLSLSDPIWMSYNSPYQYQVEAYNTYYTQMFYSSSESWASAGIGTSWPQTQETGTSSLGCGVFQSTGEYDSAFYAQVNFWNSSRYGHQVGVTCDDDPNGKRWPGSMLLPMEYCEGGVSECLWADWEYPLYWSNYNQTTSGSEEEQLNITIAPQAYTTRHGGIAAYMPFNPFGTNAAFESIEDYDFTLTATLVL